MVKRDVVIVNKLGVHLRAAAVLVKTACTFESDVYVCKDDMKVDAKSIMGILGLAAGEGTQVTIIAEGPDEEGALKAVVDIIEAKFGEEE